MDDVMFKTVLGKKLDELRPIFKDAEIGKFDNFVDPQTSIPEFTELIEGVNNILKSANHRLGHIKDSEEMKEEFLALAAHQLRSPLSVMRWDMEILTKYHDHLPPEIIQKIEMLAKNNKKMIDLVNDILTVSRIDLDKVVHHIEEIDINNAIARSLQEFDSSIKAKEIEVEFTQNNSLPMVWVDIDKLQEVFQNVIGNAIKFTPALGQIEILIYQKEDSVVVRVSDSGIGIPTEELNKLGGKFYRASNAVEGQSSGTGLGLFIAKKYLSDWGGNILIESPANSEFQNKIRNKDLPGTSVYITLPTNKGGE